MTILTYRVPSRVPLLSSRAAMGAILFCSVALTASAGKVTLGKDGIGIDGGKVLAWCHGLVGGRKRFFKIQKGRAESPSEVTAQAGHIISFEGRWAGPGFRNGVTGNKVDNGLSGFQKGGANHLIRLRLSTLPSC